MATRRRSCILLWLYATALFPTVWIPRVCVICLHLRLTYEIISPLLFCNAFKTKQLQRIRMLHYAYNAQLHECYTGCRDYINLLLTRKIWLHVPVKRAENAILLPWSTKRGVFLLTLPLFQLCERRSGGVEDLWMLLYVWRTNRRVKPFRHTRFACAFSLSLVLRLCIETFYKECQRNT